MTRPSDTEAAMRAAREIAAEIYEDEGVDMWMNARIRQLDGERPVDLIARGEGQRVIELLNQLADGNFA